MSGVQAWPRLANAHVINNPSAEPQWILRPTTFGIIVLKPLSGSFAVEEGVIDEGALAALIRIAEGSVRALHNLLQSLSPGGGKQRPVRRYGHTTSGSGHTMPSSGR